MKSICTFEHQCHYRISYRLVLVFSYTQLLLNLYFALVILILLLSSMQLFHVLIQHFNHLIHFRVELFAPFILNDLFYLSHFSLIEFLNTHSPLILLPCILHYFNLFLSHNHLPKYFTQFPFCRPTLS